MPIKPNWITTPDSPAMDALCARLADRSAELDRTEAWPAEQLAWCGEQGVFRWFVPRELGGFGWNDADIARGYRRLSAACMTTTFIITQRTGASQRIIASGNQVARERWLAGLLDGREFATVAISHLTTSRRHLGQPALRATPTDGGYRLDGLSPWVTGGEKADVIVTGATLDDGQQILVALPTDSPGVTAPPSPRLVALTASHTGEVHCQGVFVPQELVLAGPDENVMRSGVGAGTGGLQTSTLAIGLAGAAIDYIAGEAVARPALSAPLEEFRAEHQRLLADLLALAAGAGDCSSEDLRTRANSLVLRTTQAALGAAKGTGYVVGHPAGRAAREALFFLVWSCPQGVLAANLCELAGLGSTDD